ncbi:MAG: hypothetical protein R2774_01720 [Saprospiraceae bacterium]
MSCKSLVFYIIIFIAGSLQYGIAQSPRFERQSLSQISYNRLQILGISDSIYTSSKGNLDRKNAAEFFNNILQNESLSEKDKKDVLHCIADNYEHKHQIVIFDETDKNKQNGIFRTQDELEFAGDSDGSIDINSIDRQPILTYFYQNKANFFDIKTPSFELYLNPVFDFGFTEQPAYDPYVFQNTRGIELRAYIDKKVYVYTRLLENQRHFTDFVTDRISKFQAIPGQGSFKGFSSGVVDNLTGYDYFNTVAYIGFNPIKSISVEFGHDNHFIGDGYRSLLLSDYASNYLYLKLDWKLWKFRYQNIFSELSPISIIQSPQYEILPRKYAATHYLTFIPHHNFEVGVFETVVFGRENHFEFQYLNPVIFYRSIEHSLNSSDNVILGLNVRWNVLKRFSLYGQIVLDEFKLSEVQKASGWWANKFGYQAGLKYINAFGIDHLDLQLESNVVRPYTYTHWQPLNEVSENSVASYSNYNQPLAHILGASFDEKILLIRYVPINKITLTAKGMITKYGEDKDGLNYGNNILLNYNLRTSDYGNFVAQGVKNTIVSAGLTVSYEFLHNFCIDLYGNYRTRDRESVKSDHHAYGFRVRANIAALDYDY